MDDDELNLIIGMVVDPDQAKLEADLNQIIARATNAAQKAVVEGDRKLSAERSKERKKGADREVKETVRAMQRQAAEQRKLAQQELAAFRFVLNARLKAIEQAFKEERNLNRKNYSLELVEEKAAAARALQTQKAANVASAAETRKAESQRKESVKRTEDALRASRARQLADQKKAAAQELEATRTAGRSQYVAEQAAEARRTARTRAFLRTATSTYQAGLRGSQTLLSSFLRRRETSHAESERRITNSTRSNLTQQTSVIRQQLETQNSTYTRAAQRRLQAIERNSAKETKVISAAAVKQAEAVAAIQQKSSVGVIGAATRGGGLGGIAATLAGLGGGRYAYDVLADFQSIQTTFRGIFEEVEGGAPRTEAFLAELKDFAKTTPFTLRSLAEYSQKFFANGLVDPKAADAVDQLKDKLLKLADAGAATGKTTEQINGAVLGLTQISASGRLSLEDLRQVTEGIGLRLSDVAAELGLTTGELFKSLEDGTVGAEEGLNAIFEAMTKIPGAAGAAARQSGNLRGAFSNLQDVIDSLIVKYLAPLAVILAKSISGFAEFIGKLSEGQGVYKIVRDGLTGVAFALGLIIAAKGAVQVLGLTNKALLLLAANPGILALGALAAAAGILYKSVPGIKNFFGALAQGTVNWAKVGYKLDAPIGSITTIVGLQSRLGSTARNVHDFFESLVVGTRNWVTVGSKIEKPITDLGAMVALQTSFGVAAKTIADGLGSVADGAKELVTGGGTGRLQEALKGIKDDLSENLSPAKGILADRLQQIVAAASQYLSTVRLNVGSFLLSAFGLAGNGGGGIVSRLLRRSIGKLFLGAFADLSSTESAAELGTKLNDVVTGAVAFLKSSGLNVGNFIGGLFSGEFETGNAARNIGVRLNRLVAKAAASVGDFISPILDNIAAKISSFFSDKVIPAIVEVPRIIGRFLSRTLFSEGFLKALAVTAAGIAGVAIVIAGQFVRGFIEGLIQRRGDIAKTILDILKFAVGAILGTGNPFIILGATLVAALAGAKVVGAFSKLRDLFHVAQVGIRGDLKATQEEARKLRDFNTKVSGPGARVGNAAITAGNLGRGLQSGLDKAAIGIYTVTGAAEKLPATIGGAFDKAGDRVRRFGEGVLGTEGTYRDAAGRMRQTSGSFANDTEKQLGVVKRSVGQAAVVTGEFLQNVPRSAKLAFDKVGSAATTGYGKLREQATRAHEYQKANFSKTEAAAAVAFGAMTGYALGFADSTVGAAGAAVGAIGGIATAFAAGGPILGGIAIVSTAIGALVGRSQREAQKAKAEAQRIAEEIKVVNDGVAKSFQASFEGAGNAGPLARSVATLNVLRDSMKTGGKEAVDFSERFGGTFRAAAEAAAKGTDGLKAYGDALKETQVQKILAGDSTAIRNFSADLGDATSKLGIYGDLGKRIYTQLGTDGVDAYQKLVSQLQSGEVDLATFQSKLEDLGVTAKDAAAFAKDYAAAVREGVDASKGGVFIDALSTQIKAAAEEQAAFSDAAAEAQRQIDVFGPFADRLTGAYGRIKESIDKAANAYRTFIDVQDGGKTTLAQGRVNILEGADSFNALGTDYLGKQQRDIAVTQAQRDFADQVAQLGQGAGTVQELQNRIAVYVADLKNNASPAQQEFIDLVTKVPETNILKSLITDAAPAVKSITDLKSKISDFIATLDPTSDFAIKLNTGTADEKAQGLQEAIALLENSDPTVKAALDDEEFQKQFKAAKLDITDFTNETATKYLGVDIVAGEGYKEFLEIYKSAQNGTLDPTRGQVGTAAPGRPPGEGPQSTASNGGATTVAPGREPGAGPSRTRALVSSSAPVVEGDAAVVAAGGNVTNVDMTIVEAQAPRLTALEVVRHTKAAQFRGGQTLRSPRPARPGRRPSLVGAGR